jgi:hypothetical protein
MRAYGMDDRADALPAIDCHGRRSSSYRQLPRSTPPSPGSRARVAQAVLGARRGPLGYAPGAYRRRVLDFFGKYPPLTPS